MEVEAPPGMGAAAATMASPTATMHHHNTQKGAMATMTTSSPVTATRTKMAKFPNGWLAHVWKYRQAGTRVEK